MGSQLAKAQPPVVPRGDAAADANLWSSLLGLGETGMRSSMLFCYAFLFGGIGLFIQGWRELYRAHRENRLAVAGLYGLVRHPQYTGLFIALFGEGVVHWPAMFSVGLFPIIVLVYALLARSEEKRMLEKFGDEYRIYRSKVPMFFPRAALATASRGFQCNARRI